MSRREQKPKGYGRSEAFRFDKRSEFHRTERYEDEDTAIAESLAAWGYDDPDDVVSNDDAESVTDWREW